VGPDFVVRLADLDKALSSIEAVVGPTEKRAEIAELELQASAPDCGTTRQRPEVTSRLSALQAEVDRLVGDAIAA
jgi:peptide chain release factor 2